MTGPGPGRPPGRPPGPLTEIYLAEITQQLFAALSAELGLVVRTSDPREYFRRAYAARKRAAAEVPELAELTFKRSPTQPDRVWIIKAARAQQQQAVQVQVQQHTDEIADDQ